jgi:hypothetical protein
MKRKQYWNIITYLINEIILTLLQYDTEAIILNSFEEKPLTI